MYILRLKVKKKKFVFYENADNKLTNYSNQNNMLASSVTSNTTAEKKVIKNVVIFIKFKGQADIYAERGGYQNIMNQIRGLDEYTQPKGYYMKYSETNPIGYSGTGGLLDYFNRQTELLNRISDYVGNDFLKSIDDNREYNFTLIVPECGNWGDLLWSHQGNIEVLGKRANYSFVTVTNSDDIRGSLRHEFLHTLGFPDMYRYKNVAATVGGYSIMGCAQGYPTVYERFKYGGWIQNSNAIKEITKDGQYSLSPASLGQENTIAYKIPVPGTNSEYFMVEYRGASVAYKFTCKNNTTGEIETLVDFNSNSVASWLAKKVGNYTLTVEAKDSLTTVKKELNFVVEEEKGLSITSVISSLGDKFKTNTETTLTINTDGGINDKTYNVSVDGRSIVMGSTSNTVNWKPTKAGTYTIDVQVNSASSFAIYQKTITVEDVSSNQVTIYYKGYSNPYIHYQIGSGQWTNAPGIKMVPCIDVAGYEYKAVIDLGTATTLNACFNNGYGLWDSNNGSNYYFSSVGTYTYSSGKIVKIQ